MTAALPSSLARAWHSLQDSCMSNKHLACGTEWAYVSLLVIQPQVLESEGSFHGQLSGIM
jgi:hypothetical protein